MWKIPWGNHRSGPVDADHPRDQSHPTRRAALHGGAATPETAPGNPKNVWPQGMNSAVEDCYCWALNFCTCKVFKAVD